MRRARTNDPEPPGRRSAVTRPVVADASEYDARLGIYTLFFVIPRHEVVYWRVVVESWEDLAVARTMQKVYEGDPTRSLVVAMAVPDFLDSSVRRLARLCDEIGGVQVPATKELREALRRDLSDADPSDQTGSAG